MTITAAKVSVIDDKSTNEMVRHFAYQRRTISLGDFTEVKFSYIEHLADKPPRLRAGSGTT